MPFSTGETLDRHLDEQRWHAWLTDDLSEEETRALAEHLASGCEQCEEWLAGRQEEPLDFVRGVLDDRAGREAVVSASARELAFDSVMERVGREARGPAHRVPWYRLVRSPERAHRAPRRRSAARRGRNAAFFVGAVVTVFLALWFNPVKVISEQDPDEGVKGAARSGVIDRVPEVSVSFALARSGRVIRPGRDGDTVPGDADLLFRFRVTGGPAYVYLMRETKLGRRLVWPLPGAAPQRLSGEVDLAVDGVVQGVSVSDTWGEVRFVAVASAQPLDRMAIRDWPGSGPGTGAVTIHVPADD